MTWLDGKLDRNNSFIAALIAQSESSVSAVRHLETYLDAIDDSVVEELRAQASAAAELRRVLIDDLHQTFITPLDREDIFNLSHCNNDVVTYALTTAEEMNVLNVEADSAIRQMIALVRQEAQELELALMRLPESRQRAVRKCRSNLELVSAVLSARSLSPHIQYVRPRGRRRTCFRHGGNEIGLMARVAQCLG